MAGSSFNSLSPVDYIVMALMLLILTGMGIYHGMAKRRPTTTRSFFLADRSIFSLPIALTILASFISPITLLGYAAETYFFGGHYLLIGLQTIPSTLVISEILIPVFYGLEITTAYQYFYLRYGFPMRLLGALCFLLQTMFYVAIVSYTPALVVNAVTNLNLWIVIVTTGLVCTFYTTMGGIKAVIWTDVFLAIVMSGTSILVIVSCLIAAGGFGKVWEINRQDRRFEVFNFPVDPTTRTTFLSVVIGTFWSSLSIYGISQTAVQRFLSARSMKDAKWSMWLNIPFSTIVTGAATLQGVVLYAFYHTKTDVVSPTMYCDGECTSPPEQPVTYVNQPPNFTSPDQIVMIFVNQQFSHIPGYQGIFISCIFAGALSTISSGINSMVAVTIEDIWKPLRKWLKDHHQIQLHDNDARDTKISKILSVLFGLLSIGLAFLASRLGTLVTIINSVLGIFGAPILGAFLVGMLWKRAVPRAVLCGTLLSISIGVWIIAGSYAQAGKPDAFYAYRISFFWYGTITVLTTMIVSVLLGEILKLVNMAGIEKDVDPSLLCWFLRPSEPPVMTTSIETSSAEVKKIETSDL